MKKIKIIQWDDERTEEAFTDMFVRECLKKYSIEIGDISFHVKADDFISDIKRTKYDLIIIDLKDQNGDESKGLELIQHIAVTSNVNVPILVYTKIWDKKSEVLRFKSVKGLNIAIFNKAITKVAEYTNNLEEILVGLLNLKSVELILIPHRDLKTQNALSNISLHNLEQLISNFLKQKNKDVPKQIEVKSLTPGLSGAYVLQITMDNIIKLIKITNNYEQIKKEYDNLIKYSELLRSIFKVDFANIPPDQISYKDWYSIFYEYVPKSKTLFSWLTSNENLSENEITKVLSFIFSSNGILNLYENKKEKENINIVDNILIDINNSRKDLIFSAIDELIAIINENEKYYDKAIIEGIFLHKSYKNISDVKIGDPLSNYYLCHNDLHSNNILIDSLNNPILIDFGNIRYKNWSSDICRLIVDLFLRGIDYSNIKYFDIYKIEEWVQKAILLIKDENIPKMNDSNDNIICAINWLRSNAKIIFMEKYVEWEFQLNMAVEFIKSCYKSLSLPPGKRALSVICASESIKEANKNILTSK